MNQSEAKFLLRARRPGSRDAANPVFAAALAAAGRDPELQHWLERERGFDDAMTAKLAEIAPPPGLRAAILEGVKARQPPSLTWRVPAWFAAAAAVALLMTQVANRGDGGPAGDNLANAAIQDLLRAHDEHVGYPAELADIQRRLATATLPLRVRVPFEVDELILNRCRTVRLAGREVFEICFQRDGAWYHLYALRSHRETTRDLIERTQPGGGALTATAWSDGRNSYALVTSGGRDALRRVL